MQVHFSFILHFLDEVYFNLRNWDGQLRFELADLLVGVVGGLFKNISGSMNFVANQKSLAHEYDLSICRSLF